MIRWVLNIIVLLLLLRLALRFVLGLIQGLAEPPGGAASGRGAAGGPAKIAGELVKDPVCATYVPRDTAIAARVAGETRYYCSVTCRDKDAANAGQPQPRMGRAAHG
jgi:YHS domain-containing protein